jgi:hypothetical protein
MAPFSKPPKSLSLAERVEAIHSEIEALLNAKVEALRRDGGALLHPGVVKQTIVRGRCLCQLADEL